ncbi:MAG: DUF1592 domain-containing protein [Acidobacteriota bacterium]
MPPSAVPGEIYPINDVDLASRRSYFLWATAPDTEFITLAEQRQLSDPEVLEQ